VINFIGDSAHLWAADTILLLFRAAGTAICGREASVGAVWLPAPSQEAF
jgi:hypothetical protein